ncbi:MAG: helix-turn-helix domain-containing protein [Oliverpabstia sp.]
MKSPDHLLGFTIKAAREAHKMTQEQLAEAAGISTVYVSEIENKRTVPSFNVLCSICQVLNISLDSIIFRTESGTAQSIARLLTRCNENQLQVIYAMIEAMLKIGL